MIINWKQKALSATAALALTVLLAGCMPYTTGPTEVGVRTNKLLIGARGVVDEIYQPGSTYFFVPYLTDWHTFDISLQNLEMTIKPTGGDRRGRDDLTFKTIDGNDISLDIIVSYRIIPEMAPYILQNVASSDDELKNNIVRTIARSKPRDLFGELMTEDFYDASKRAAKAEAVKDAMNEIMEPYGIRVERVSTKDYRFNPKYQQAIADKKLADQQVEKNKAAAMATTEEYLKKVEQAKGEVGKITATADGEYDRSKIEVDAYYERQVKIAQAIEAEGKAEAEAILKMNEALAGAGGEAMVKIAIAEALMNKQIVLLPMGSGGIDIRSTDINSLLQLYGLKQLGGQTR